MQKRILSMLLCLTMIFGLVPVSVSAEDEHIGTETVETVEEAPNEDEKSGNGSEESAETSEESDEAPEETSGEDSEDGKNSEETAAPANGETERPGISENSSKNADSDEDSAVSLAATSKVATVEVNGATKSYSDIIEAFDVAQSSTKPSTITLEDSADLGTSNIVISKECAIFLDLNGYEISGNYGVENGTVPDGLIVLGGSGNPKVTLTITNSYESSDGRITNKSVNDCTSVIRVASTNATLDIYDGTFQRTGDSVTSANAAVIDVAFGSAEISGGTIKGNVYGITAESGAKNVTVKGDANIYGYYASIYSLNDANVNLSGGTFSSNGTTKPTFKTVGGTIGALLADGYAFYDENGVIVDRNTGSSSFTENVSVLEGLVPVNYIDKNGNEASVTDYISLVGNPDGNKLDGTAGEAWYVVSGNISATQTWDVAGNVNIILTDGSSLSTDGYYFEVAKDAFITVYGQEEGTGVLSIRSIMENVAALGGTERTYELDHREPDGSLYSFELGSLAVYGGKVMLESTKYRAAYLKDLIVMGGTVTAKAPDQSSAIRLKNSPPTLAENYKICLADDPQEKSGCGRSDGRTVLITECTQHLFRHKSSETSGKHIRYCTLCSVSYEEDHVFNIYGGDCDENTHSLKCECGAATDAREAHDFEYYYCDDTLTHMKKCKVCRYGMDETAEEHDFSENPTLCSECGFKRAASVKIGDTITNCGTLVEAIDIAGGKSETAKTDGVVTLYGGADCFPEQTDPSKPLINMKWGRFTIDFNGAELSFPRATLFRLEENAEVTLKNGKFDLSGNTSSGEMPGIIVDKGGLTLENMTIYAACNAFPDNDHIQYPAVKISSGSKPFSAKNVVFGGGIEVGDGVTVTPFTDSSFIYSCETAANARANPVIKISGDKGIAGIIADGYALAEYSNPNALVFMCNYDENGVREELTEIDDSVTVVPHAEHTFNDGYCLCGYRCDHTDGFNADGKCNICGAQAVASVGEEMFSELTPAFARANELSAQTDENVKINIIADIGDLAETGVVTKKITIELNGHALGSSSFIVGTTDDDDNVTAEGDLTITDSSELKTGIISSATLNGGTLNVTGGKSNYGFTLYGGTAYITDHETGNINIYGGTVNLTGGEIRNITANTGELNISDSTVERLTLDSSAKTNIFGGTITGVEVTGGELNVNDGEVKNFKVTGGKAEITDGIIEVFTMAAGYTHIENGNFSTFTASMDETYSPKPRLVIEGGEFEDAYFFAKTKGRITLYGGIYTRCIKILANGGEVSTLGDLLASNYMFYSLDDSDKGALLSGDTEKFDDKKVQVKRHNHRFGEKTGSDGKFYGECECGVKAEAAIESTSGTRSYYATFVEAAAKVGNGETLTLCSDVNCEGNVTIEQKGNSTGHITLNLDGHSLNFAEGNKLSLLDSYIDVIDDASENGYISHMYVNWPSTQLYGGSYGQLDADTNMMKSIRGNGYGYKKTDGSGWVKNPDVLTLTDVAVKKAPYSVTAIVTNTPDGTETPDVIYPGQKLYFKLIFVTNSNLDPISESNPASCSVDYIRADGKTRVVGTNVTVTGNDAFISEILPEDAPAGNYRAKFENIEFYGCTQELAIPFTVEICSHESYTNGYCDTCGYACKHPEVSESGVCDVCKTEFSAVLTTADGTVSYYTDVPVAIATAALAENKGSTVKLLKTFSEENELYLEATAEARGEFTIDLNGYYFGTLNSKIFLRYIDLTIMTSVSRGLYTVFNTEIRPELYSTVTFPEVEVDTKLEIYRLSFNGAPAAGIGTNRASLGSGVYLEWFDHYISGNKMKYNDILAPGCIFKDETRGNIYPRSEEVPSMVKMTVIKCPHSEWNGNECTYCGLVCNHLRGFVDGICPDCGRACEHPHLNENFFCIDCKRQMVAKVETKDGVVTYNPDFSAAINEAESDATVTLLTDTTFMDNVYVCGVGRNITLNLNGFEASSGRGVFNIGGTGVSDVGKGGTLKIVGDGKLMTYVNVYKSATLDLSERTGGDIKAVAVYPDTAFIGSTLTEAYIGSFILSEYNTKESLEKAKEINLNGGSYGEIFWQTSASYDLTLGFLLAPGYAFRKDGSFVPYETKLSHDFSAAPKYIQNVTVVKCEEHYIEGEENTCEYCGTELAASVVDGDGALYKYYADIGDAVKAQLELGDTYTVKLLRDFLTNVQLTLSEGNPRIDLNGHTVKDMWLQLECRATILGEGKIEYLSISADAGVNAAVTVAENIWIMQGATWSSILPDASFGYKVTGDNGSKKWYDSETVAGVADSGGQLKNASIEPFPITGDPIILLDGKELEDGHIVSDDGLYKISIRLETEGVECKFYCGLVGNDAHSTPMEKYANGLYESYYTTNFQKAGKYEIWAVATKDGYTRTTEKFTIVSKKSLAKATIELEESQFIYYPHTDGTAGEFTVKVKSVTLPDGTVLEDSAYEVGGVTSGTEAGTCTLTITAKDDSDYTGSASTSWRILPCEIKMGFNEVLKRYDGTTDITLENSTFGQAEQFVECAASLGTIKLTRDKDFEIKIVSHEFTEPDANVRHNVLLEITLKNPNYTFKENGNNVKTKQYTHNGYIASADLPAGCEPDEGTLVVRNGVKAEYKFDVTKMIKELPEGLHYNGSDESYPRYYLLKYATYGDSLVELDDKYYTDGASIDKNGLLTLPINAVDTKTESDIGTIKVMFVTQNYGTEYITVNVRAENRIVPTGEPKLSRNAITYGEPISSITLSGTMHDDVNNVDVEGTFVWLVAGVPPAGTCVAGWEFIPDDVMYAPAKGKATITVNKADIPAKDITPPTAVANLKYNGSEQNLITKGTTPTGTTMQYKLGENGTWGDDIPTATKAGRYDVYYQVVGGNNYNNTEAQKITCEIEKRSVIISNKLGDEGYKTGYMYGDIIQTPKQSNFEITGSEGNPNVSFQWIGEEPQMFSKIGSYTLKVTVDATANTAGGSQEITVTIARNTRDYGYSSGFEYMVYNNAGTVSYEIDYVHGINPGETAIDRKTIKVKADDFIISVTDAEGNYIPYDKDNCDFKISVEEGAAKGTVRVTLTDLNRTKTGLSFCMINFKAETEQYADIAVQLRLKMEDKAQKTLGVTMSNFTYGDTASVPVYNAPEEKLKTSVTYVTKDGTKLTEAPTQAGDYTVTVVCETKDTIYSGSADYTIAKKEVTADVKVGGNYTYNGTEIKPTDITVKDGDAVIPDSEYNVGYADNKDAGDAKVIITNAENGNYIVNGVGVFKINKATVKVKPKDISKVYGTEPKFKLESESDLITEEELAAFASTAKFYSKGTEKTAKVIDGGYEIMAELTENETDNLILTLSGTGILTVVPKKLTIKVNDVSRIYGEPNPELSVSYDGFIDGEDESVLGGVLVLKYNDDINETALVGPHENATTASGLTSDNYAIEFVPGNVTIAKIPVNASAGTARRSYLNVVFDKSLEGLSAGNFIVKNSEGNIVTVTNIATSSDSKNYTLSGNFEVGKEYTVKVILSGATVDATHQLATDEFVITPIRTSSGGGGTTSYTVSFETNGGSELSKQTVTRNTAIKEPTAPTKEGFDFAGWYTDKELKTKYDFSAKVTKNITLYAAWTKKDNSINQIILTIGEKTAQVFGQTKTNDVAPKIVNDRTMLPARFVAENLGADVSWDGDKELVTIQGKNLKTGEDVTILIHIGSDIAYVNGNEIKLDSVSFIENDRTYTPVRFISEELGASVEWIESEQKVVIAK